MPASPSPLKSHAHAKAIPLTTTRTTTTTASSPMSIAAFDSKPPTMRTLGQPRTDFYQSPPSSAPNSSSPTPTAATFPAAFSSTAARTPNRSIPPFFHHPPHSTAAVKPSYPPSLLASSPPPPWSPLSSSKDASSPPGPPTAFDLSMRWPPFRPDGTDPLELSSQLFADVFQRAVAPPTDPSSRSAVHIDSQGPSANWRIRKADLAKERGRGKADEAASWRRSADDPPPRRRWRDRAERGSDERSRDSFSQPSSFEDLAPTSTSASTAALSQKGFKIADRSSNATAVPSSSGGHAPPSSQDLPDPARGQLPAFSLLSSSPVKTPTKQEQFPLSQPQQENWMLTPTSSLPSLMSLPGTPATAASAAKRVDEAGKKAGESLADRVSNWRQPVVVVAERDPPRSHGRSPLAPTTRSSQLATSATAQTSAGGSVPFPFGPQEEYGQAQGQGGQYHHRFSTRPVPPQQLEYSSMLQPSPVPGKHVSDPPSVSPLARRFQYAPLSGQSTAGASPSPATTTTTTAAAELAFSAIPQRWSPWLRNKSPAHTHTHHVARSAANGSPKLDTRLAAGGGSSPLPRVLAVGSNTATSSPSAWERQLEWGGAGAGASRDGGGGHWRRPSSVSVASQHGRDPRGLALPHSRRTSFVSSSGHSVVSRGRSRHLSGAPSVELDSDVAHYDRMRTPSLRGVSRSADPGSGSEAGFRSRRSSVYSTVSPVLPPPESETHPSRHSFSRPSSRASSRGGLSGPGVGVGVSLARRQSSSLVSMQEGAGGEEAAAAAAAVATVTEALSASSLLLASPLSASAAPSDGRSPGPVGRLAVEPGEAPLPEEEDVLLVDSDVLLDVDGPLFPPSETFSDADGEHEHEPKMLFAAAHPSEGAAVHIFSPGDRIGPGVRMADGHVIRVASTSGEFEGEMDKTGIWSSGGGCGGGGQLEVVRMLGEGSYAVVYLVREVDEEEEDESRFASDGESRSASDGEDALHALGIPVPVTPRGRGPARRPSLATGPFASAKSPEGSADVDEPWEEEQTLRGRGGAGPLASVRSRSTSTSSSAESARPAREFALKCLSKSDLSEDMLEVQRLEATIHQSLPFHPNIVTLHRVYETPEWLFLVLEYCPGQDLYYWLEQARDSAVSDLFDNFAGTSLNEETDDDDDNNNKNYNNNNDDDDGERARTEREDMDATPPSPSLLASTAGATLLSRRRLRLIGRMFCQMCDAVQFCHDHGISHRDIKPENFIVEDRRGGSVDGSGIGREREREEEGVVVKLTDFGLATAQTNCEDFDCGSKPYMAYECRNNLHPSYDPRQADVWSLGIVLLNLLYHRCPFSDPCPGDDPSFDSFRADPVRYLVECFEGLPEGAANFLARNVFCEVEPGKMTRRVSAKEFGEWASDLACRMGLNPGARTKRVSKGAWNSATVPLVHSRASSVSRLSSFAGSPKVRNRAALLEELEGDHHLHHHHLPPSPSPGHATTVSLNARTSLIHARAATLIEPATPESLPSPNFSPPMRTSAAFAPVSSVTPNIHVDTSVSPSPPPPRSSAPPSPSQRSSSHLIVTPVSGGSSESPVSPAVSTASASHSKRRKRGARKNKAAREQALRDKEAAAESRRSSGDTRSSTSEAPETAVLETGAAGVMESREPPPPPPPPPLPPPPSSLAVGALGSGSRFHDALLAELAAASQSLAREISKKKKELAGAIRGS